MKLIFLLACISLSLFTAPLSAQEYYGTPPVTYKSDSDLCKLAKYQAYCHDFIAKNHSRGALVLEAMVLAKARIQQLHLSCRNFTVAIDDREPRLHAALRDCSTVLDDAVTLVSDCVSDARYYFNPLNFHKLEDMQTSLSGALTDYQTCMDGLYEAGKPGKAAARAMSKEGQAVDEIISTALSLLASMHPPGSPRNPSSWITRRSLATSTNVTPNVTVAKDGSGQFTTITAAVNAAPTKSKTRYVIYVKQGVYTESFEVPKNKTNIMIIGDGIRKTVITGNKSVQDAGVTTFTSATVVISGNNFLAQGVTFQNTAGAASHQAVAVRVSADQVAFYRCSFEGYQDTLYAHSLRQFYSECRVYGTVDFVFGNAAAVFMNSEIVARVPLTGQQNTYTAQGRTDPNQNTGFSFQNCSVDGNGDLKNVTNKFPTYLGRPWKEYSLTVFLRCYEGDVIHPAGWLEWDGNFALKTLFYGEYLSIGPGSATSKRVSWSTQIRNQTVANQFSVRNFLSGQDWLPATTFPFVLDV